MKETECSDPNNEYCVLSVMDNDMFDIKVTVNNSAGSSDSTLISGGNMNEN